MLITDNNNESYYRFFLNMSQVNGFKGFVGFSIRELNSYEMNLYCNESSNKIKSFPLLRKNHNFTSDFMLRTYSSGCYYYDPLKNEWSSEGVDIDADSTNLEQTSCLSSHLTEFAGGFIVLPAEINFDYVWANASFTRNPVIYTTVIVLCIVYILIAVLCRYYDVKKNLLQISQNKE